VFLGFTVVIDTTVYQFNISSIGGQSSLLFGVLNLVFIPGNLTHGSSFSFADAVFKQVAGKP
jgi:hypothetical protein